MMSGLKRVILEKIVSVLYTKVRRALELSALTSGSTGLSFASEGRFFSIFVARSRQVIFEEIRIMHFWV